MKYQIRLTLHWGAVLGIFLALTGCADSSDNTAQMDATQMHAVERSSQAGETDLRLANTALASGNTDMSISLYQKILNRTPDDQAALLGLGNALYQAKEIQQARTVFEQLETLAPRQIDAELGLARINVHEHELDAAVKRYQSILQRTPDCLAALDGLGTAYDLQHRHDLAQATYRKALLNHPDDLGLRNNLGLSLIFSNQLHAAIAELLTIADNPSAPPQARQNLALAYGLLGNNAAAERVLQTDMSAAQVQNNLQYYQTMRNRLAQSPAAPGPNPQP